MPSQYQFLSQLDPTYYPGGGGQAGPAPTAPGTSTTLPTPSMSDPLSPGPSNANADANANARDQAMRMRMQREHQRRQQQRQRQRQGRYWRIGQEPDLYEEHQGYCFGRGVRDYCTVVDWQTGRPALLPNSTEVIWQLADPYGRTLPLDRNDATKGNAYFAQVPAYRVFIWIDPEEVAE